LLESRTEGYKEGMLQYGNKFAQKSSCFVLSMCDEYIEIFGGYYILQPNLTLASISFLVYSCTDVDYLFSIKWRI
jgi:hypothetical protein